jgi:hypothetical protein
LFRNWPTQQHYGVQYHSKNDEYQRIYSIPGAFEEIVKRYLEMGISEIIFFYPFAPILMPMFEQIVNEAIPQLRSINPNAD